MKWMRVLGAALSFAAIVSSTAPARAESAKELQNSASKALKTLYRQNATAQKLGKQATGILVFPSIVKAGFLIGGQVGEGVLFKNGKASGYYNSVAASYGLQAGVQTFGYALFFMTQKDLEYLDSSSGWEVGVGPSIVVIDEGAGKSVTSTTLTQNVYAFIFSQKGLMGGLGVQGSKITKIDK